MELFYLVYVQASHRYVRCALWQQKAPVAVGAAVTSRQFSSDAPPENISRYPIPNKKDLPFDMVELMEEVENKVGCRVFSRLRNLECSCHETTLLWWEWISIYMVGSVCSAL